LTLLLSPCCISSALIAPLDNKQRLVTLPASIPEPALVVVPTQSSKICNNNSEEQSRRSFFHVTASLIGAATLLTKPIPAVSSEFSGKILVLGGTGFVGKEVCHKLESLGIDYIATSRDGRDGTYALDFTESGIDIASQVARLSRDCTSVISCIGSIGTSSDVFITNSGTGFASNGAKAAGVKNFVYISVAPEVKESVKNISAFNNYMQGKLFSETAIKNDFPETFTIISPTFIYGGDKFGINPPRVASGYGKLVEGMLSSKPLRSLASVSPGFIGVALEPPVRVSAVADAAVAGALGLTAHVLDTYDEINQAARLIEK
jgi:hypothetical protein